MHVGLERIRKIILLYGTSAIFDESELKEWIFMQELRILLILATD